MSVQERFLINPYRCLDDLRFQRYLKEVEILREGRVDPSRWAIKPTARIPVNSTMVALIKLLEKAPTYVHPYDSLAKRIHGSDSDDDIATLTLLGKKSRKERMLVDPESLYRVDGLGFGLAIEQCRMSKESLAMIYSLWHYKGRFLRDTSVAKEVYGAEVLNTLISLRNSLDNNFLKDAKVKIEYANFYGKGYYRLPNESPTPESINLPSSRLPRYLEFPYQKWLMQAGVIVPSETAPEYMRDLPLKSNKHLSDNEQKIINLLLRYPGYVIPYRLMTRALFKGTIPNDWRDVVSDISESLKKKVLFEGDIYVMNDVGWAVGVKEVKLSKTPVMLLRELWGNYDQFTTTQSMAKRIYGSNEQKYVRRIASIIGPVKDHFENGDWVVGTGGRAQEGAYIITDRDRLVA